MIIKGGAVDFEADVQWLNTDGTSKTDIAFNSPGIEIKYRRAGAFNPVTMSPVTLVINGAHNGGATGNNNCGVSHSHAGLARMCFPDDAVAAGSALVTFSGVCTGGYMVSLQVQLNGETAADLGQAFQDSTDADGVAHKNRMRGIPVEVPGAEGGLPVINENGYVDSEVQKVAANAINAAAVATSGLALAAGVNVSHFNGAEVIGDGSEGDPIRTEFSP